MANEDAGGVGDPTGQPGGTGGSPAPTGQPGATPPAGATPGSTGPPEQTVPLAALHEERRARQQLQRELNQLRSRPAPTPTPPSAPDPAHEEVRRNFYELFPHFKAFERVKPEQIDGLLGLLDREPQREAMFTQYWQNFGRGALRALGAEIKSVYGGDLDPASRRYIDDAYVAWLENDPDAQIRFYEHDPTLAGDFIKAYSAALLEPYGRGVLAKEQARAERRSRLPMANPRTNAVPANGKPPKKLEGDEVHTAAAEAYFRGSK